MFWSGASAALSACVTLVAKMLLNSRVEYFLSVLIDTGEKKRIITLESVISRDDVGNHCGVYMAQVRPVVDVVDRCRDIELGGISHDTDSNEKIACYTAASVLPIQRQQHFTHVPFQLRI